METEAQAVLIESPGPAQALVVAERKLDLPAAGEARVRNHGCGVNFIDVYQRKGLYPLELPAVMGNEAAGEIVALGDGAAGFAVGDRVAYCTAGPGCYMSERNVPAGKLVRLPEGFDTLQASATMLRGLTAEYLSRRCWPVTAGMPALVTAAAGGVGVLLCQWLERLGADVVGVVGSDRKAARASAAGCAEVLVGYDDLSAKLRSVRPDGVGVVYDSVGAATWPAVLDCLAPRGCLVSYGNASGPVPQFAPLELSARGSLYVTRPTLAHYARSESELRQAAMALFAEIERGLQLPEVSMTFAFEAAAAAHDMLESRACEGVIALVPDNAGHA